MLNVGESESILTDVKSNVKLIKIVKKSVHKYPLRMHERVLNQKRDKTAEKKGYCEFPHPLL